MECEWVRLPAAKFLWTQIRRNSCWQGWGRRLCEAGIGARAWEAGRISINRTHGGRGGGQRLLGQGFSLSDNWALREQGVLLKLSLQVQFFKLFGILCLLSWGLRGDIHLGQTPSL